MEWGLGLGVGRTEVIGRFFCVMRSDKLDNKVQKNLREILQACQALTNRQTFTET